jgi:HJR/Mrr/RecB family endonuclease
MSAQLDTLRRRHQNLAQEQTDREIPFRLASQKLELAAREQLRLTKTLRAKQAIASFLTVVDGGVSRWGGLPVFAAMMGAIVFVIAYCLGASSVAQLASLSGGIFAGVILWIPFLRLPAGAQLGRWIDEAKSETEAASQSRSAAEAELLPHKQRYAAAELAVNGSQQAINLFCQRLTAAEERLDQARRDSEWYRWLCSEAQDLSGMEGIDFERYLQSLFEFLGYATQTTPAHGDYGADLIVTKNGRRTCIQAKRWKGAVGVDAVMATNGAKAHYQCDASAVITSSTFTPNARVLATSTKSTLIDGSQIRDLIEGRIVL